MKVNSVHENNKNKITYKIKYMNYDERIVYDNNRNDDSVGEANAHTIGKTKHF